MSLATAQDNMIKRQFRTWGVLDDHFLGAVLSVERSAFLPPHLADFAYADQALTVDNTHLMPPKATGKWLQGLEIKDTDTVLEINTQRGYSTAILAHLAKSVTTVPFEGLWSEQLPFIWHEQGLTNITVTEVQTGLQALQDADSKFDVIVINGALPTVPEEALAKLAPQGRLAVIAGQAPNFEACVVQKLNHQRTETKSLFEIDIPYLPGIEKPKHFTF